MDLNQIKTLEEWKEFLDIAGLKLTTLDAEAFKKGEWITPFVKDDMDWLEGVLGDLEHKLYSALMNRYCKDFSDFIAFLPSFRKAINRKIADIEHLVKATKTVNDTSAIDLMMDETSYPYELGS